ncbi:hypothetical protein OUZ56_004434 [Daphnia magna]|uniref:Uncharacterized protein n=1 Tax=Daphnia magna TaxID=35525 RepID=A0ABQ9YPX6_9CRUS|nr:hypothetical protein OUZ56_004434 [Daphnia magna]
MVHLKKSAKKEINPKYATERRIVVNVLAASPYLCCSTYVHQPSSLRRCLPWSICLVLRDEITALVVKALEKERMAT